MTAALPRPTWMAELVTGVAQAPPEELTRFAPPEGTTRRSAVLMLYAPLPGGGEGVVLTERASTLRAHPGQVSFPGGKVDDTDEHTVAAALREAEEEVGVDPRSVDVVASLPELYLSPSANAVTPVLAWWSQPALLRAVDPAEVERVALVPVAELVDPARRHTAVFGPYKGPAFEVSGLFVWGFTAQLLALSLDLAGLAQPWDVADERPLPESALSPWMRGRD